MDDEKRQTIFLVLLVIIIIVMIVSLTILVKNKNLIMTDTLIYGMELHNFTSCGCYDSSGILWSSTENGFESKQPTNLRGELWDRKK